MSAFVVLLFPALRYQANDVYGTRHAFTPALATHCPFWHAMPALMPPRQGCYAIVWHAPRGHGEGEFDESLRAPQK
eukprot:4397402-Lingulodinium_polyedra.AAC.1